ncbi:hypothetical protein PSPO01_09468 [Paraphaeosphaeria sporulosa]
MAYPGNPWAGNVLPLEDGPNFPLLKYSRKERRVLSNSYDEVLQEQDLRCTAIRRGWRTPPPYPSTRSSRPSPSASRMPVSTSQKWRQFRKRKTSLREIQGHEREMWRGVVRWIAPPESAVLLSQEGRLGAYLHFRPRRNSSCPGRCLGGPPDRGIEDATKLKVTLLRKGAVLDILPYVGNTPQPSSTMYPPHAVAIVHVSPNLKPRLPAPQSLLKSNHTAYHPDVPFASSPVQLSTDTTTLNITSRLRSPTHPHKQKQHRHHQHPYPAHARALEQASTPASSAVPIGTFASRRTSFPSSPCLPLVPNARQAAHPPPLPNAATILARRSSGVGSAAAKREAPTGRSERACTARSTTMQCGLADCDDDAALEVTARLAEGAAAASASTRQAITVRLGGPRCHSLSAPHRIPAYRRPVRANNAGLRLVSSRRQDPVSTNEPLRPRVGARPFHRKRKRSLAHASRCPLEALRPRPIACRRRASSAPVRPARRTATRGATSHSMTHRLQSSIDPIVCTPTSARHAPRCVAGLGDEGPAGVVARVPCRIAAAAQQRTPRSAGAPGLAAQLPRC